MVLRYMEHYTLIQSNVVLNKAIITAVIGYIVKYDLGRIYARWDLFLYMIECYTTGPLDESNGYKCMAIPRQLDMIYLKSVYPVRILDRETETC